MIRKLLIANRGEIACRVIRTARAMGIPTVAVYSDADADAPHVRLADEAVRIGPAPVNESYLLGDAILNAAARTGADAVHPGYGFLSENAGFADACKAAGITFVGPSADAIRAMGEKDAAKALMEKAGVPVVPGYHGDNQDPAFLAAEAEKIGYPVLIKAVAGGGGKGMRLVESADDFDKALQGAMREAANAFGNDRVLIEKFVTSPRHIEVQVFGDAHGNAVHLFERDCSLQRRHQKVIEEAPAPGMTPDVRAAMGDAAVKAAKAINYQGAGTIEFIVDGSEGLRADRFWFMEMNTRLQVEHPVTEAITGLDLVEWQLRVASGQHLPLKQEQITLSGHAVEARLYAENPYKKFLPSTGDLVGLSLADQGVRVDTGVAEGGAVTMFYDPMIAKVIAHGETRDEARHRLIGALQHSAVAGPHTNLGFLVQALAHPSFAAADIDTGFIDRHLDDLVPAIADVDVQRAIILASLARLLEEQPQAPLSPWQTRRAFRVGGGGSRVMQWIVDGEDHAVTVTYPEEGFALRLGDDGIDAIASGVLNGSDLKAHIDGHEVRARIYQSADKFWIVVAGQTITLTARHSFAVDEFETDGSCGDGINAPMPGKVIAVSVAAGDVVKKGQSLGILEAMKMENSLVAPRDGVIAEVRAAVGDQVEEGTALILLEPEGA